MDKFTKILVTVVAVVIFVILFGIVVGVKSNQGNSTPGIVGLILFAALIGALKAIWKKNKRNDNEDNTSILQK